MKTVVIIFNSLLIACCITQTAELHFTCHGDQELNNFMAEAPTTIEHKERLLLKSRIAYGKNSLQHGVFDQMFQNLGMILFNGVKLNSSLNNSKEMANTMYHLCKKLKTIHPDSLETAKSLLSIMPQETVEQKLHHCVGLMALGEAHLSHDLPTALTYFKQAASEHKFMGAMLNVGLLTLINGEKITAIHWLTCAQEHGLQDIENIIANAKNACLMTEDDQKALEKWEEAYKHRGFHLPEESNLPSIHDID